MGNGFSDTLKGGVYTAHSVITATATSTEYDITGYNALICSVLIGTATGTWKIDIRGRLDSTGTVMDCYDNNDVQLTTGAISSNRIKFFAPVPNLITLLATESDGTATCTVKFQPINI